MSKIKLPSDVAAHFELVEWTGGTRQHFGKYGLVDLEKITLTQAKKLASKGFPKLKPVKPAPAKAKKEE
jgi:hypothetical protein